MRPLELVPRSSARATRAARAATLATVLGLAAPLMVLAAPAPARADEPAVPSRAEVRSAHAALTQGARDVATVRADLARLELLVEQEARQAQQAAEAFNGARYAAQLARREAQDARAADASAQAHVERVRLAYAEVVRGSLSTSRDLDALSSIMAADGLTEMLDLTSSYRIVGSTLDARFDDVSAARDEAAAASDAAAATRDAAARARDDAAVQRDRAKAASRAVRTEARSLAERAQVLVVELARLQGISVAVAQERQDGLARRAAERAAAAAASAAPSATGQGGTPTDETPASAPAGPAQVPSSSNVPTTSPAPAPSSGAQAAVAFARAQLGDRYVWAAAGPDAWDCSGLTMGAWAAGGKTLPHYSVAQYDASTPIAPGERRPGDLLFWAASSDPSSIYHVALYVGDDRIIHAPRAGRPVSEDSLFAWIAPTFYARP